jgi:hypothetical protein
MKSFISSMSVFVCTASMSNVQAFSPHHIKRHFAIAKLAPDVTDAPNTEIAIFGRR